MIINPVVTKTPTEIVQDAKTWQEAKAQLRDFYSKMSREWEEDVVESMLSERFPGYGVKLNHPGRVPHGPVYSPFSRAPDPSPYTPVTGNSDFLTGKLDVAVVRGSNESRRLYFRPTHRHRGFKTVTFIYYDAQQVWRHIELNRDDISTFSEHGDFVWSVKVPADAPVGRYTIYAGLDSRSTHLIIR